MALKEIIPERYENKSVAYKYINRYVFYDGYVSLYIEDRKKKKPLLEVLFDTEDFDKVVAHHWTTNARHNSTHTRANQTSITIGKLIGRSDSVNYCAPIKKGTFDYRKKNIRHNTNSYEKLDDDTSKLTIQRLDGQVYEVLFDTEDYDIISPHTWRVAIDSEDIICVHANINRRVVPLHRLIVERHGEVTKPQQFRIIRPVNNKFDFRKKTLKEKYLINYYKQIDDKTYELIINSTDGVIRAIIDAEAYKRVSKINWGYVRCGLNKVIKHKHHGVLSNFILKKKHGFPIVNKDDAGRYDFRKKSLKWFANWRVAKRKGLI